MALDKNLIVQGIFPATQGYPSSAAEAARIWSDAYETYAKLAQAQGIFPLLTGSEKGKLLAALLPVWNSPESGSASANAAAWFSGITQFWMSPPVLFIGPFGPGTIVVPPLPTLTSCLIGTTLNSGSAPPPLQRFAGCLDTTTKGIQVLMPQVPPTPPIIFPLV